MDYAELKQLAKVMKCSVKNLIVMAPQNDPFYCGTKADKAQAQWFGDLWERFGFSEKAKESKDAKGMHLRRIHYILVSQGDFTDCNGKPYENTDECWGALNTASRAARYLKLVPVDAFVDMRNPPVKAFYNFDAKPDLSIALPEYWDCSLPSIEADLYCDLSFPELRLSGFEYQASDQPYLLEIWCEKSTMNDVLIPLCEEVGANFVTGLGFLSITAVQNLIDRTRQANKPCRVFYISDFDPAGVTMPRQIARQVEFWLAADGLDLDIALEPVALTRAQIDQFNLPRVPIKESDLRAAGFEAKNGEGACELDALEALHPGSLRTIILEAMSAFIDVDLRRKTFMARHEAMRNISFAWEEETAEERSAFKTIATRTADIIDGYREQLEALAESMQAEFEPIAAELESLQQAVKIKADGMDRYLPDKPTPSVSPKDDNWLFRSDRDYLTQLANYHR
ncbi:MAG: hypothetical protein ACKN9W_11545 [Methylococcus sp.]